ncbi:tyrosine-type recombinase/integrase [Undibacterium sp.]|jgi:site-specific recombinase XerD|uniref:tyrosine-type recombinase/integrase n=1 Tax=Undibacterium sp. TaxID=1914977 RepID=UPI002CF55CF3|nr:tyrosine-type recombinase/integrase [Undibacterium sp.]HTD04020.1 tyrosine-type recombinase/integrase [Undibacterium sp.]
MDLLEACNRFLVHCEVERKLSPLTIKAYQGDLHRFSSAVGPKYNLCDFSETWIENVVRNWLADPELKSTTVKRRMACIKSFVRWLFRRKLISFNPFERIHLEIRLPKRLPRNLQTNEIQKLLVVRPESILGKLRKKNQDLPRFEWDRLTARLAIEVLTLTGIRVGELVKIKPQDIDYILHQIRILGKGNRERQVLFPDLVTTDRLQVYREHAYSRFGAENRGTLFLNSLGRSANEQYIRRIIRAYANEAQLARRITPHMLRHTAATQLLEAGLDIRFVQKLLGHASITTTEIYTHVANHALRLEISRVNIRKRLEMHR